MRDYSIKNIDHSMFDFKAYYDKVAEMLPDNCRVCEVGVANGASAIYLLEAILNLGKTIDKFVMVENLDYGGMNQAQTIVQHLSKSGVGHYVEIVFKSSLDASCLYNDGYFHFVYIDASHTFEGTKADIRLWHRKMLDGWILAGHDANMPEVKQAIEQVIPASELHIIPTDKDYGVWETIKDDNKTIN